MTDQCGNLTGNASQGQNEHRQMVIKNDKIL